jgi:hypothetical protein
MDSGLLGSYSRVVQVMVGASTRAEVDVAVDRLVGDEAWDACGEVLLSATELAARALVARLLECGVYAPLAVAGAMRRQVRPPVRQTRGAGTARRVFMDIDAETATAGVPDYIQAEQDDLAALAAESRDIAARREAERDADPIRVLVVNELAKAMITANAALDALMAVVRASAWEETRRSAALKIVNQPLALRRLAEAGRIEDLLAVATSSRLESAAQKVAGLLTSRVDEVIASGSADAIWLLARHHPDPAVRERATQAAPARR